mmetsp:Transcript_5498/g.9616  ORF Transcript_5498/g.9616 Transcript_5498/m.9616 type:complete len:135 (+) Transcript_5498:82-486(+)|eukprot:CAMPEP_0194561032 /NCGR_PEP_ID=MMETSP0292-20121207/1985_1 /TAXON_ID=39354 /ORGANISM="Heterosigma akashiwo, Strain CCMP2393" /LENGTH=134 /DNA_ID=CAMNT_0039409351 /DNA_START=78 /DNA_END=482 /DNA_ORIENTATION=+
MAQKINENIHTEDEALKALDETSSTLSPFGLTVKKQEQAQDMYNTETKLSFDRKLENLQQTERLGKLRASNNHVKALVSAQNEPMVTQAQEDFAYSNLMTEALLQVQSDKENNRKRDGFTHYTEACARNPHFRK